MSTYYCDPSVASNGGTGSLGDPYTGTGSCLAYALTQISRDTSNGDRLILLDEADEVLSTSLAPSGYTAAAPLVIEGQVSGGGVANFETGDGMSVIDLNDGDPIVSDTNESVHYYHLDIRNGDNAQNVTVAPSCQITECYVGDTTGVGISVSVYGRVKKCYVYNCGGDGIYANVSRVGVEGCYVRSRTADGQGAMTTGIALGASTSSATCINNIVSVDAATIGISAAGIGLNCKNNNILSSSGTGTGITLATVATNSQCVNNIIEGFNTSGVGVAYGANTSPAALLGNNKIYNCATQSTGSPSLAAVRLDDTLLTKTPFLKSGADTFANRANYFAPRDTGGILGGAF